jgi:hypothetical protein
VGDVVYEVDGQRVRELRLDRIEALLAGRPGTKALPSPVSPVHVRAAVVVTFVCRSLSRRAARREI